MGSRGSTFGAGSMTSGPSHEHAAAVAEGARHHLGSKTYSGSLMRPHVPYLSDLIRELHVTSALDYGCGKGEQYRWQDPFYGYQTVEERWGFEVTKYDPCHAPYTAEPTGMFDLVICTHTLSLVPLADLDWVLGRLFGFAAKAVFVAEKIGERKKGEVADPGERAIGWLVPDWLDRMQRFAKLRPKVATVFSSRERIGDATITTRYRWYSDGWVARVAGPR
jgi:hypothetical protein